MVARLLNRKARISIIIKYVIVNWFVLWERQITSLTNVELRVFHCDVENRYVLEKISKMHGKDPGNPIEGRKIGEF